MSYTFAIGDIHGCISPLRRMLARIGAYASGGTVVFLGDYVDRGPDSKAVLDTLTEEAPAGWRWISLKGNHEDMMVGAQDGRHDESWWLENGGLQTLASYGHEILPSHLQWAAALPLSYQDQYRLFVHAGVKEGAFFEDQTAEDLMWTRFPGPAIERTSTVPASLADDCHARYSTTRSRADRSSLSRWQRERSRTPIFAPPFQAMGQLLAGGMRQIRTWCAGMIGWRPRAAGRPGNAQRASLAAVLNILFVAEVLRNSSLARLSVAGRAGSTAACPAYLISTGGLETADLATVARSSPVIQ